MFLVGCQGVGLTLTRWAIFQRGHGILHSYQLHANRLAALDCDQHLVLPSLGFSHFVGCIVAAYCGYPTLLTCLKDSVGLLYTEHTGTQVLAVLLTHAAQ